MTSFSKIDYLKVEAHFKSIVSEKSKLKHEAEKLYFDTLSRFIAEGKIKAGGMMIVGIKEHDLLRGLLDDVKKAERVLLSAERRLTLAKRDATHRAYVSSHKKIYSKFLTE
jgi:hypothetical protein